ncbi:hypothetical protein BLN97_01940 [Bradyrhizobium elkanii]|nr:hypothetical protein BLN97_01940 [Bradyrhizobium elkanii]
MPAASARSLWVIFSERLKSLTLRPSAAFARRSVLAKDSDLTTATSPLVLYRPGRRGADDGKRRDSLGQFTPIAGIRQGFVSFLRPMLGVWKPTGPIAAPSFRSSGSEAGAIVA